VTPCCSARHHHQQCIKLPAVLFFYSLLFSCRITGTSSFLFPSHHEATTGHGPPSSSATAPFELPSISDLAADDGSSDAHTDTKILTLSGSRGEIVGATGRVGSFLLRSGRGTLAATPRGVSPGSLSESGTPVFVAVHAAAVPHIVQSTLPSRRKDLVFVTNGLPSRILAGLDDVHDQCHRYESAKYDADELLRTITLSVPHFGVLSVGGDVVTSSSSPPTFVHGRHSSSLASLLQPPGIVVEQVSSRSDLQAAAVKKLMWSSTMWLLCHEEEYKEDHCCGVGNKPITVEMVHEKKEPKLHALVEELLPAANDLVGKGFNLGSASDVVAYFRLYSLSMPDAIPSKDLALNELPERNGLLLNPNSNDSPIQTIHKALLERVAGPGIGALSMCRDNSSVERNDNVVFQSILHSACPSMAFITQNEADRSSHGTAVAKKKVRNAVVIGGGFIGSSVALALSRRGIDVAVLDKQDVNSDKIGVATKASWAWLNANDKTPWSYFSLNHLGMKAWRNDRALSKLPVWCGGLVRRTKRPPQESTNSENDPAKGGAYVSIGPLTRDEVVALDSAAEFLGETPECGEEIFFYPDEGHVDPLKAMCVIREEASKLGAKFVGSANVEALIVDDEGMACGGVITDKGKRFEADIVIVAAGVGSKGLSGLDIIRQPGMVVLATTKKSSTCRDGAPRRILVDTINEAHILQRNEGELAIGGGYLQVGGVGGVASASNLGSGGAKNEEEDKSANAREMIRAASQVSPLVMERVELSHAESADRPMPSDGLPAVGFVRPGLFCVVSHSGITLGPLLGELAAIEIVEEVSANLLQDFRPTRFENSGAINTAA
jgi:glycine/D-amino acid oxidase-like deaminating enzyme